MCHLKSVGWIVVVKKYDWNIVWMKQWTDARPVVGKTRRVMTNANDVITRRAIDRNSYEHSLVIPLREAPRSTKFSPISFRKNFAGLKSFGDYNQIHHARLKNN